MAISKVNYNSLNVTPTASKFLMWDSDADALQASDVGGSLKLISTQTASHSSTITFSSGIDSTYKEYIVKWINVHPNSNDQQLTVNFRDGSTAYDATKTSTAFRVGHAEDDSGTELGYQNGQDLAQSTSAQSIHYTGNANEATSSGTLHLFDPSNTTFMKHYILINSADRNGQCEQQYISGYCNVTAAIDGIQFGTNTSTIGSGTFKLYGVS